MAANDPTLRVLVLCIGNSIRSQFAEAFLTRAGEGRLAVASAGTNPWMVHPLTIRTLAERGIDWTHARSKHMNEFLGTPFDVVVTVCEEAREACPVYPGGGRRVHRTFRDPVHVEGTEAVKLAAFREIRDEIEAWATAFAKELLA